MCTSIISNRKKTIVGWNLDLLDMKHRVAVKKDGVHIEILDKTEGWMPIFGANERGDFVGMPTCWPYDKRSEPTDGAENVINLDISLLLMQKSLRDIKETVENKPVCSVPGVTFMPALSDKDGNYLQIVPGQGVRYSKKPKFAVTTNFSPFKMDAETHPWMGWDRYQIATKMLESATDDFDVKDCFAVLKAASQTVCPTVVSMVYDVTERTVYLCENMRWDEINSVRFNAEN